jgi:hypothetical protein
VVHVADHRELPGKKTWTWGTDDNGDVWVDKLTDGGGQYVEFQGGRFETQMEHQFIAPHRVEHFFEYWFGVNQMGGAWNEATRHAALRIKILGNRASILIAANERSIKPSLYSRAPANKYIPAVSISIRKVFDQCRPTGQPRQATDCSCAEE